MGRRTGIVVRLLREGVTTKRGKGGWCYIHRMKLFALDVHVNASSLLPSCLRDKFRDFHCATGQYIGL